MAKVKAPSKVFAASKLILAGFVGNPGATFLLLAGLVVSTFFAFGLILPLFLLIDGLGLMPSGLIKWIDDLTSAPLVKDGKGTPASGAISPVMQVSANEEKEATPEFAARLTGLFNVEYVQNERTSQGLIQWVIATQDHTDPRDVGRALDAYYSSVHYERYKRGLPLNNDAGERNPITYIDDGAIIETIEREDGSEVTLVATGVTGCVSEADYAKAKELELAGHYVHWTGQVAGRVSYEGEKQRVRRGAGYNDLAVQPLYTLKIEERVTRNAVSNANPFAPPSTLHGDAAFAWWGDLQTSRATRWFWDDEGERDLSGMVLGQFQSGRYSNDKRIAWVQTVGEGHSLTVGAPGSGKFTAGIAPLLLTADAASIIVFDVKNGEAARKTGRHRARLGDVLVLDPFGVSGHASGALNPMDVLKANDPGIVVKARNLVEALYVENETRGDDDFWNSSARSLLTAFLIHVATSPTEEGNRTLKRVREIIRTPLTSSTNPRSAAILKAMSENLEGGGIVRDKAEGILAGIESGADKQTHGIQSTLEAQTDFLDIDEVQAVTATTTLDPVALRQKVGTLYVVVPESKLKIVSRWLRLIYQTIMGNVREDGVPLHVVIDEFPALGYFPRVVEDMARVRSLGIRMHVIVQSLSQLQQIYRDGWQTFTANAKFLRVLSANDEMTQKHVSSRLGKTTIRTRTQTANRNAGGGGGSSQSNAFTGAPLMTPDQVGRLDAEEMLVIVEGEKPLRLAKVHAYEHEQLRQMGDF